ncbi:MAG: DUF1080 domain-containing protein, partial [Rhodothermales bacterium]|nr:DUF1080 domain-containing protein [Rhodothermales bacterium]
MYSIRFSTTLLVLILCSSCTREQSRPWVFRSVLDDRPRIATASLDGDLYVAYDAQNSFLYKAWRGGVGLEGAVYTTIHGPQPTSEGEELFRVASKTPWSVFLDGEILEHDARYRGHKFVRGNVVFLTELSLASGDRIRIEEMVQSVLDENNNTGLRRTIQLFDAPTGMTVALDLNVGSLLNRQSYSVSGGDLTTEDSGEDRLSGQLVIDRGAPAQITTFFSTVRESDQVVPAETFDSAALIASNDCTICHNAEVKTVGPSWQAIAVRYDRSEATKNRLATRIIEGGSGIWGEALMTPHPDLSESDARRMVDYILAYTDSADDQSSDPVPETTPVSTTINATYAAPVIDGQRDSMWGEADELTISRLAGSGSTVNYPDGPTVRLLYDAQYLYAFFEVPDETIVADSENPYDDDAVEIYLDGGYEREDYYDENDVQYIFPVRGDDVWINGDASRHIGVEHAAVEMEDGYSLEARIPLANVDIIPTPGIQFGLQFHVDDDDDGGSVERAMSWSTNEPMSWSNTSLFGTAILGEGDGDALLSEMDRDAGVRVNIYELGRPLPALYRLAPNQLPNVSFTASTIDFSTKQDFGGVEDEFIAEVDGLLKVNDGGEYEFELTNDDGARFWFDNQLLIDNPAFGSAASKSASVDIAPGLHTLRIQYFDARADQRLALRWRPPGESTLSPIPADRLSAIATGAVETSPGVKYVLEPRLVERPGDRSMLTSVHPAFNLATIRPGSFEPRVGGMDFLSDGRLVICTWDADGAVYILENVLTGSGDDVRVKRIGEGLAEPLGLKVVDDEIYVLQKQELTKLIDYNGDDLIDEYRTISNDWGVTANFHEFAFGLVFKDDHFYATLATAIEPGGASSSPQEYDRGRVVKIAMDGAVEFVASGLRTPNGIGIGVDDEIFVTDNQGDWLPSSKMVHVVSGAFYGNRSVDPNGTTGVEDTPPVVWMPQDEIGNSPSQPAKLVHGPYAGQMIYGEVTHGGLKRVFVEQIDGTYQGALFRFTQGLEAGINRVVTGPNESIYVGGIGSAGNWGQIGKKKHGLQRLDYTGNVPFEMLAVRVKTNGFEIEFTGPLPDGVGSSPVDYDVEHWRYVPTSSYGGPKVDHEKLDVISATVGNDRTTVFLEIPGMDEGRIVYLHLAGPFASTDNERLWTTEAWYTLNKIPESNYGTVQYRPDPYGVSQEEEQAGFVSLFPAGNLDMWTGYGHVPISPRWQNTETELYFNPSADPAPGDLMTAAEYDDFELRLDWKLSDGGNSGVFFNVDPSLEYPWESGPEMQILENRKHGDGRNPLTSAAANYALHAPAFDATRKAGEWNEARLIVRGDSVQHWLNGFKLVDYVLGDA